MRMRQSQVHYNCDLTSHFNFLLISHVLMVCYKQISLGQIMNSTTNLREAVDARGIGPKFILFISILAIFLAALCAQKGHSARDILAYLTFVFIVVYSVRRA